MNCQVCFSKPFHGVHFGALTCRACAAYFCRAVHKNYKNLKCRRGDGKCERKLETCKKCRIEKCFAAGMSEKKIGRELIISTRKQDFQFIGRPDFIIFHGYDNLETSKRSFIDFTQMINKASKILMNESKSYVGMNTLNQLTNALKTLEKHPKICERIGKNDMLKIWETNFLKVAEWFKYCDKFQELPLNMRIEFCKTVWFTWSCLQNFALTAQEITYMLAIFSFRHAAKQLSGGFEELSDNMIEILGNEMHNYYINNLKLGIYAHRISKMMNFVNILDRYMHQEMEKMELDRLFDLITVDLSHPEIFYGKK